MNAPATLFGRSAAWLIARLCSSLSSPSGRPARASAIPIVLSALSHVPASSARSASAYAREAKASAFSLSRASFRSAARTAYALPTRVADLAKRCGRALESVEGLLLLIGQIALVRILVEQLCTLAGAEDRGESQRATVLRRRFAVSTDRGGTVAGRGRVAEDCGRVSRALGMVGQPLDIRGTRRRLGQRGQRPAVQHEPPGRRERVLGGEAGQLVPEGDALDAVHEHPRREAFVERVEVAFGQRLEQPERHVWGRHSSGLEQRLGLR